MLTSTRRKTIIRTTLNHALNANPRMLPRSRALEDSPADTPGRAWFVPEPLAAIGPVDRSGSKRANRDAGGQAVRGETGFGRRHRGSASGPESGASRVFVPDRSGSPLMPCHPARARRLVGKGRAVVVRLRPFTIRLRDRVGGKAREVGLKVDPGAKSTGHSGGRTKFNRTRPGIPKSHALDAACVGETPALRGWRQGVLAIRAMGRGPHARTGVNRFSFPVGHLMAEKCVRGFRTGDIVRATVRSGKRRGVHAGRVAVRRTGAFNVRTARGTVQGISHRRCRAVQRADGCGHVLETSRKEETATMHGTREPAFLPALKDGLSCG